MAARKKKRSGAAKPSSGRKLGPTIKKHGWFQGPGVFVAKQSGIKSAKKIVPAAIMLVALSALTPPLGAQIASSVRTVPIVAPLANTLVGYGAMLRGRLG